LQLLDEELDGEEEDLQITNDVGDDGVATGYDPHFQPLDTDDPLWL